MIVPTWQMKKQETRNQRFSIKHLGRAMVEWTDQLRNNESEKLQDTREVRRIRHRQGQSKQQRGKTGQIKKTRVKIFKPKEYYINDDYRKTNDLQSF